jgi:hypothetical protein
MTAIGAISLAAGVAWGARSPLEAAPMRDQNARLEHRLDGPHAAMIRQDASEQRAIERNAPQKPWAREPGRTAIVGAAMVPVSPPAALSGPQLLSPREVPRARGGGPVPTVQRFSSNDVGVSRGVHAVGASTVSAPIGCSRIEAVAAPHVRSLDVNVTNDAGESMAHAHRSGRLAVVSFCPRDDGQYFVTARAVGGTVADPVQLFVE